MRAFDALRQADARRRIAETTYRDIRALTSYSMAAVVADVPVDAATDDIPTTAYWAGPIGMESEVTGDGRMIADGALRWEIAEGNRPPYRWVGEDVGAHDGAVTAGLIYAIERRDGGVIWAEGDFDMATDAGREAYRQVKEGRQNGVSMDLDDVSFEIRVAAELLEGMDEGETVEAPKTNDDGTITVVEINSGDEIMVTTDALVRAVTGVAVPAFKNARIAIVDSLTSADAPEPEEDDAEDEGADSLVAAAPLNPPGAWFDKMNLDGPTALTVTKDGRVYGHAAIWGTCHISHSAGGKCITPPNSPSEYAWFHTGALETAEGALVSVGHLTMNTGHAEDDLSPAATLAHYDNTGTVAADVRMYEDEFGIQYVGALRPSTKGERLRAFMSAPISGDWRRVGNALEMVGALSVNVPGFGVPRPGGHVRGDNLVSLMASGVIVPVDDATAKTLSADDVKWLNSFVASGKRAELADLVARRNRVKVDAFARRRKG
ncbi:hypothetical protein QC999_gp86 [Microbacterium phage Cressida]|uniref:Capsid maturation protease n=1 Tax=Microbacterium phage Cressida TaxID=2591216 RepID=A0A514DI39_9CAUD|nr:hypothetical protein QC999_gp86 [Microbacterium phage Cressida]QDH93264.1 hypothetical protein PBI_CRESSIDA_22 [Microbacterium phage Cressida]